MTFNPKELDQLHFNREYGDFLKTGAEWAKGLIDSFGAQLQSGSSNSPVVGGSANLGGRFRKTSNYGYRIHPITGRRKLHKGDDYGAPMGTPIPSKAGGIVTVSGFNAGGWGNYVKVNSGNIDRLYAHMSRRSVNVGQTVRAGQTLGLVGST